MNNRKQFLFILAIAMTLASQGCRDTRLVPGNLRVARIPLPENNGYVPHRTYLIDSSTLEPWVSEPDGEVVTGWYVHSIGDGIMLSNRRGKKVTVPFLSETEMTRLKNKLRQEKP